MRFTATVFSTSRLRLSLCCGSIWAAIFQLRNKHAPVSDGWPVLGGPHSDIYVFEDFARSNASRAIGRLHDVVADTTAMFPPKCVDERERFSELFGPDQKSCAVDLPFVFILAHCIHPWGREGFCFSTLDF